MNRRFPGWGRKERQEILKWHVWGRKEGFTEVSKSIYRKKEEQGVSLVVQWLRIHLPVQGTWAQTLVGEVGSHMPPGNYAHGPQLLKPRSSRTRAPQQEKPLHRN